VQIQVILSLVAILGAACVALVVDYFRNKNQQLREAMVEMKVRQIEKERQLLSPATLTVQTPAPSVALPLSPLSQAEAPVVNEKPLVRTSEQSSESAGSAGEQVEFTPRRRRRAAAVDAATAISDRKDDDMNSKKELSDWLLQRAVARAARKMAAEEPQSPEPVLPPIELVPVEAEVPVVEPSPVKPDPPVVPPPSGSYQEYKPEPVIVDEFLWRSLFEPQPAVENKGRANSGLQVVPVIQTIQTETGLLDVPAGLHDIHTLDELKKSDQPFSGLVVSLGITQNNARPVEELAQNVSDYIQTVLRDSDFACRTAEDEYLLICPNLTGVSAHRHLSALSERLWDFQLRALGSFLMLFSLGGVDAQREPLPEVIASATERMSQTKRSRKAIVMLTPDQRHRKAV
jgi:hypothetical protein